MVTWVLAEEPGWEIARAIEIVEHRLGCDPEEVTWLCADVPVIDVHVTEPVQE